MTPYVALLRAVNLGAKNKVSMSELRDLLASLGFEDVRTILQSGNAVFRCDATSASGLEATLEREIARSFHLKTTVFVRDADEIADAVAHNPFPRQTEKDPSHVVVSFLGEAVELRAVKALQAAVVGPELVRAHGRHLYVVYPDGIGRSRLTGALFARHIRGIGTARNWSTVVKLAEAVR